MSRRLKKIGTAIFDIVGFINFRLQETKGNCWIDQLYDKDYWGKNNQSKEINNEIKEYLNKGYSMGCAGRYTHEPLVDVNGEIVKIQNYLRSEERRVGKECSEPCRSRWSPYH